ncbi:DNMT2, partial [Symbiodinium necroappetens]
MLPHSATDRWLTRATPANSRVFRPGRQPAPCEKPTRRWKLLEVGAFVFVTLCRSPGGRRRASTPRGRALSRRALRSVFEFFSGVGGMRLSFKDAVPAREPFPTWRAFEVDEACCQAYCELYGSKYVTGVRRGELWKNKNQRGADELWRCSIDRLPDGAFDGGDLWLMSPPCQPFTRTGKQKDLEDPRCKALLRLLEALPALAHPPQALLLENIPEFRGSRAHQHVVSTLSEAGYATEEHLLSPITFGFPNTRERFYLIAVLAGQDDAAATAAADLLPDLPTLPGTATARIPVRPVEAFLEEAAPSEMLRVPEKLLEQAYRENRTLDLAGKGTTLTKTFTSSYGKAEYGGAGLSKTGPLVMEAPDFPEDGRVQRFQTLEPARWKFVRYFSPREVASLMGFPEAWELPDALSLRTQ